MKRKKILGMFSTLSRATVIGLAAVVSGALVVACSNDNPAALTSLNNDATLQKSSGITEAGAPRLAFGVMGGHMQHQGHFQMVQRIFDHGQNPQAASESARAAAYAASKPELPAACFARRYRALV